MPDIDPRPSYTHAHLCTHPQAHWCMHSCTDRQLIRHKAFLLPQQDIVSPTWAAIASDWFLSYDNHHGVIINDAHPLGTAVSCGQWFLLEAKSLPLILVIAQLTDLCMAGRQHLLVGLHYFEENRLGSFKSRPSGMVKQEKFTSCTYIHWLLWYVMCERKSNSSYQEGD